MQGSFCRDANIETLPFFGALSWQISSHVNLILQQLKSKVHTVCTISAGWTAEGDHTADGYLDNTRFSIEFEGFGLPAILPKLALVWSWAVLTQAFL
jgi:hypothetical protein